MKKSLILLLALCGSALAQTAQSPDGTVVTAVGSTIVDAQGNVWAITNDAQVTENGTAISYTAGVTEIALVGGTVWQYNGGKSAPAGQGNNWYSFAPNGNLAIGPTTKSPLPSQFAIEAQLAPSTSAAAGSSATPAASPSSAAAEPSPSSATSTSPATPSSTTTAALTGFSAVPVSQPTPYPGNTTVNVASNGSNWPGTLSNNTTYILPSGTFNGTTVPNNGTNIQILGNGPGNTTIQGSITNGQVAGQGMTGFQVWGLTIDCTNNPFTAFTVEGSEMTLQNCHIQNYHGVGPSSEVFPVEIWSCGNYATHDVFIDHCQFTCAPSGNNNGGISVIGALSYTPQGGTWENQQITNCQFDTPTDSNIAYYHCCMAVTLIAGNNYVANPNVPGQFIYEEPGSESGVPASIQGALQDDSSHTITITGNTVNMAGNSFILIQFNTSGGPPPNDGIEGCFVITNNMISNAAYVFQVRNDPNGAGGGFPPQMPGIQGITIMSNTLTNCSIMSCSAPSGFIGALITDPNP